MLNLDLNVRKRYFGNFFGLLIDSFEQVIDLLLFIDVENVFVLLEFLNELLWAAKVLFVHSAQVCVGISNPREFLVDREISIVLFLKERH